MMSRTPFRGQEEEILTRKPQVLNSLAEDYSGIPSELGWQRLLIHLCLFYHPWQVRRVCEAFFSHFFHSRALILFFGKSGREVRRGRGQRSFFPSEMRSWGLLPRAELWKWNVRMADHRGQRKMIFSSLRLPQPGPLLWGLLLLTGNRSRRLLCFCSVPHTHTHVCTHVYTCSDVLCTHTYTHTQTLHHLSIP